MTTIITANLLKQVEETNQLLSITENQGVIIEAI